MSLMASKAYKVIRDLGRGEHVNGYWIEGKKSELQIAASVQPMGGRELMTLPEGTREKVVLKLYTNSALFTDRAAEPEMRCESLEADRVVIRGETYKVMQVWDYTLPGATLGCAHFKVLLERANPVTVTEAGDDGV